MILSILAIIGTLAVAYIGAILGAWRSAQALVACVLAGIVALGLCGPLAAMLPSGGVWDYAGDAFVLWGVFAATFLGLRTLAVRLLPARSHLSGLADWAGGVLAGAATGYLTVGLCLLIVQMLPVAPGFLGYEPFEYIKAETEVEPDVVRPGSPLWLQWDRGTLGFFNYLSSASLGSEASGIVARYGDAYPPAEGRDKGYTAALDVDDFLYYHWYRRWAAVKWRTGQPMGPLPPAVRGGVEGQGLPLEAGRTLTQAGLDLRVMRVARQPSLDDFRNEKPPAGNEFLLVTLRFSPANLVAGQPRTVDSSGFYLVDNLGGRISPDASLYGPAKAGAPPTIQRLPTAPEKATLRGLTYGVLPGAEEGHYLADGAAFEFSDAGQVEARTLVFLVPQRIRPDNVRLMYSPSPPPLRPEPIPATKAPPKAAPKATPKAAPRAAPTPTTAPATKATAAPSPILMDEPAAPGLRN